MYEGNPAELRMEKLLCVDGIFDDSTYRCRVLKYDNGEDYIFLLLNEEGLTSLCLDAEYICRISAQNEVLSCTGTVRERFRCKYGDTAVFKIADGFYSASETKGFVRKKAL